MKELVEKYIDLKQNLGRNADSMEVGSEARSKMIANYRKSMNDIEVLMLKQFKENPESYSEIYDKAEKWDNLGKKIESYYVREDGTEIEEGDEDYSEDGLIGIGECAATAFNWLM